MSKYKIPRLNSNAVVAKTMTDLNFSVKEISYLLGVHRTTVFRYSKRPVPQELQQFATELKGMFLIKQNLLLAKCLAQLDDQLPKQTDIKSILMAVKILSDNTNTLAFNSTNQVERAPHAVQEETNTWDKIDAVYEARHKIGRYAGDPYLEAQISSTATHSSNDS